MSRLVVIVVLTFATTAAAQPAGSAAPAAGSAAPAGYKPVVPPAQPAPPSPAEARKACTAAMNADPAFAAEIVKVADQNASLKRDADTVQAHEDAAHHIEKNEKHVIYAYAAMWLVAAGFVLFLWRRQQALKAEIANLRRDLEAAGTDVPKTEGVP